MPSCPQCNKSLRELVRRCPTCQADLDLLVDYVGHLHGGLERAESLTRAGELGQAVWAYLEVLEVDPDNAPAKRQVRQVATAVRQFDATAPGRRWLNNASDNGVLAKTTTLRQAAWYLGVAFLVLFAFSAGYILGSYSGGDANPDPANPPQLPDTPPQLGPG